MNDLGRAGIVFCEGEKGRSMFASIIEYWTIYLNTVCMIICLVTMICLVIRIGRQKKVRRSVSFNEEIFSRLIQEQLEDSFNRIAETITRERRFIYSWLPKGKTGHLPGHLVNKKTIMKKPVHGRTEAPHINGGRSQHDKYAEIVKLAAEGMTIQNISEKIRVPKGEVDLFLKLLKSKKMPGPGDFSENSLS